jgi:ABC-type transporter Mla subunit MlaD
MAAPNLFEDLKKALTDFKTFLDANVTKIKPAVSALKGLGVPIDDLVNQLITLMGQLKTGVQHLDVANIPGLNEVSQFTSGVHSLLTAAQSLLPDAASEIASVLTVADLVSGLPSLDQVKAEILALIDAVVNDLNSLKS